MQMQSQMQQMEEAFGDMMEPDRPTIPRGDSDLFLRASLDRDNVYVGEQVTLSLYIYSRVDRPAWTPSPCPSWRASGAYIVVSQGGQMGLLHPLVPTHGASIWSLPRIFKQSL